MNEEIIQNLNERIDLAIEKGRSALADENFQKRVEEARIVAEETIRNHPVKSVLAGAAIGFILAKLLRSEN